MAEDMRLKVAASSIDGNGIAKLDSDSFAALRLSDGQAVIVTYGTKSRELKARQDCIYSDCTIRLMRHDMAELRVEEGMEVMVASKNGPKPEEKPAPKPEKPAKGKKGKKPKRSKKKEMAELLEKGKKAARNKRYADAVSAFKAALKLEPRNCNALVSIGIVYARWGKREKSYTYYKKFLEACPKHMQAPQVRGIVQQFEDWKRQNR